jgi:hypothetical protein
LKFAIDQPNCITKRHQEKEAYDFFRGVGNDDDYRKLDFWKWNESLIIITNIS